MSQWFSKNGKNVWLDKEIESLRRDIKKSQSNKNSKEDTKILMKFLCLIIPALLLIYSITPVESQEGKRGIKGIFFPDTWICKGCGYENYEGVPCAICGKEQGDR